MDTYKTFLKPLAFRQDPEVVHETATKVGTTLGKLPLAKSLVSSLFNYKNKKLEQKVLGIKFPNPLGLAAGFDYEAQLTQILPEIGFGHHTVGSITELPYGGNKRPILGRLPKSGSLLVNKGLKSTGSEHILSHLKKLKFKIPLSISIAKTNSKKTSSDKAGIKDYIASLKLCEKASVGDIYEINISCPNAYGGEPFTTSKKLDMLLKEVDKLKIKKPIFLKMPIDISVKQTDSLCKVASKHNVQGLVFGNLTKNRKNSEFDKKEIESMKKLKGSFSGKPTVENSNKLIKFAYKKYKSKFIIVGCGGIFTAEDAYKKIKLGASLLQLITGMIFEGPAVIGKINKGLVMLLEKDGFNSISEAIGKDNK